MRMAQARRHNFAEDQDGDIFNNLPDSIAHNIIRFVSCDGRSRLSCVSRRCRNLCLSYPYMFVSNSHITGSGRFRFLFNNYVDRIMSRRISHRANIQAFSLQWNFEESFDDEAYRVNTWLQHAVNLGVRRVTLFLLDTKRFVFALPGCVLSCKTLLIDTKNGVLKLPSTSSGINTTLESLLLGSVRIEDDGGFGEWLSQFKSLRILHLLSVSGKKSLSIRNSSSSLGCGIDASLQTLFLESLQIEDDYFGEWLSHFKSLEKLFLTRISRIKSMSIHNSSIDVLEIKDCNDLVDITIFAEKLRHLHILWYPYNNSSSFKSLKISAPNLEIFLWGGHVVDYYCIEDFKHKLNLTIDLSLSDQLYEESSTKYYLHKILHSMRRAKVLTLRDEFVEVLFEYGCLQYSFDHLEHLAIVRMSSFEDKIPAISSFLKGTINLKKLVILNDAKVTNSMPSGKRSFKLEYWESQNLMFTNQLKIVIMELSNWGSDVELMKYLLKNTKELEKASIMYSPAVPTNLIIELKKYKTPAPTKLVFHLKSLTKMLHLCKGFFLPEALTKCWFPPTS